MTSRPLNYYSVKVTDGRTGAVSVFKVRAESEGDAEREALEKCRIEVTVRKLGLGAALTA